MGDYNYATRKQQPGSSVKPFLDYGLLKILVGLQDILLMMITTIGEVSQETGMRQFHGLVTVENALENSWNIPAIKTFDEVQQKLVIKSGLMESIGISMNKKILV